MGCNCGKNKMPAGMTTSRAASAAPAPIAAGSRWALVLPTGATLSFGSRLEAEAERVRRGGQGTVMAS
jgi:hypothetical protein